MNFSFKERFKYFHKTENLNLVINEKTFKRKIFE